MSTTAAAVDTAELRKARGSFFTPEPVARYIADGAVRSTGDRVLEPSCGEAAFLLAAAERQSRLAAAAQQLPGPQLGTQDGVELHAASAAEARRVLQEVGVSAHVAEGDFFAVDLM